MSLSYLSDLYNFEEIKFLFKLVSKLMQNLDPLGLENVTIQEVLQTGNLV